MKLLNKILRRFGYVTIPLKPSDRDLWDICFKQNHAFAYRTGRSDEEILFTRNAFPTCHELTSVERSIALNSAKEAYLSIVENPEL